MDIREYYRNKIKECITTLNEDICSIDRARMGGKIRIVNLSKGKRYRGMTREERVIIEDRIKLYSRLLRR